MPDHIVRFRIKYDKCIQGIHWLAKHKPAITQYYLGKVFFFADKAHLMDWGRPISGDRYVAMEHGPVPSAIYDLIKDTSGEPDEIVDSLNERVEIVPSGNKRHLYSKDGQEDFPALSETDKAYLLESLERYGAMTFFELKGLSHQDTAYAKAWNLPGLNNEMDISLWFASDPEALQQLEEGSSVSRTVVSRGERAA